MTKKKILKRLWDFGLIYESELLSQKVQGEDWRTGYEDVAADPLGEQPNFQLTRHAGYPLGDFQGRIAGDR